VNPAIAAFLSGWEFFARELVVAAARRNGHHHRGVSILDLDGGSVTIEDAREPKAQ